MELDHFIQVSEDLRRRSDSIKLSCLGKLQRNGKLKNGLSINDNSKMTSPQMVSPQMVSPKMVSPKMANPKMTCSRHFLSGPLMKT